MSFPDPYPRTSILAYTKFTWPVANCVELPVPLTGESASLGFAGRRTQRTFGPVSVGQIGALLWHTVRCQDTAPSPFGFELQFRPVPSAGAIHPIHVLLEHEGHWVLYQPLSHRLELLSATKPLDDLRGAAKVVVDPQQGRLIVFVAEHGMTGAKYENPESLIWRDAGVVQGAMATVAAQLGLSMCLLGLTGHEAVSKLGNEGQLWGVGMAIVGAP